MKPLAVTLHNKPIDKCLGTGPLTWPGHVPTCGARNVARTNVLGFPGDVHPPRGARQPHVLPYGFVGGVPELGGNQVLGCGGMNARTCSSYVRYVKSANSTPQNAV
jgi:hypothetical protein